MIVKRNTEPVSNGPARALESAKQEVEANFATPPATPPATRAQQLKAQFSFRALLVSDGQKLKQTGKRWKCQCPFHDDRTPSFVVDEEDDYARCYGCEWHGDIFSYQMDRSGCDFRTALKQLALMSLYGTRPKTLRKLEKTRAVQYQFTEADLAKIKEITERLLNREDLQRQIAAKRKWKPETLKRLAEQKHLGCEGLTLMFVYKTGIKIRRISSRDFRWVVGKPYIWRAEKIPDAQRVFVTEGESDAITLLDAGMEERAGVAVVAMPSAGTFNPEWAELFTGKDVFLCLDMDEAGRKGAKRVAELVTPFAKSVRMWSPKEVA